MRSILLAVLLVGCAQPTPTVEPSPVPAVEGLVLDNLLRPIAGADVAIAGIGNTTTDDAGAFRLVGNVSLGQVVVAQAQGHASDAQVLTDPAFEVRFILTPISDDRFEDTQSLQVRITCSVVIQVGHDHGSGEPDDSEYDCPGSEETARVPYVPLAGADDMLIEAFWEPGTQHARHIILILEDADGAIVAWAEGTSPLRLDVAADAVPDIGTATLEVRPGIPSDSPGDVFIGAHIEQQVELYATTFHGQRMPAHWSVEEGQ